MTNILVVPKADYLVHDIQSEISDSLSYVDRTSRKVSEFYDFLNRKGLFKNRDEAETDEDYLQIIPYMICTQEDKYFLYERLKQGAEARLHGKLSAGIGGHVDWVSDTLSCKETFLFNANKELNEELDITFPIDEPDDTTVSSIFRNFTGSLIYDDSNPVGRVHLGALMTCNLSNVDVAVRETHKIKGSFYSKEEIRTIYQDRGDEAFETWTTIALYKLGIINNDGSNI